ncbi:WD40-repeat-containing domain protein [Yarrowia lipolytica]|jgi:F-box and WD-40 domain protein CDC4|uniref:YALI0E15290p n=2 Tax=Yarrowia lipolytica TaxID=4952 RepID=Q6C5T6_YARLI|nr:YALI0E15290p [Yarrowia lipolytica CLIB122]AOW05450.1 hypothetical protein YALI1_E18303g [Yarrowia lipolytica]KAB8282051.1 WD40-repeat-containing domain protein [Yarrowia lipolytica]KAE8171097.1 WD40-repeat-containing domain protein [Yarrowia lipolytica]KAJ8056955.1 WD40-repeat-containing domain protein [Yarrowia lipolytica]QNP98991.1 Cell division control protein 4 [Yarrowia lipolytica]|eukprot:XP_503976.1 YALI0E15290p [Yarrowia lipolytica CLIB122]
MHTVSIVRKDPKSSNANYPLRGTDTPDYLSQFHFDVNGNELQFVELGGEQTSTSASLENGTLGAASDNATSRATELSKKRQASCSLPRQKKVPRNDLEIEQTDEQQTSASNVAMPSPPPAREEEEEQQHLTIPHANLRDEIPQLLDNFDDLPAPVKNYVMFQLLRRCNRRNLSMVADIVVPALRCDLLSIFPLELATKVLSHLDYKTLCAASQVSKSWNSIVESLGAIWKGLSESHQAPVTDADVARATEQKWDYTTWGSEDTDPSIVESTPLYSKINLYKSIYRRRHLIRRNWMDPNSTPDSTCIRTGREAVITCLQFDDDIIVTASEDPWINVYDTKTGRQRSRLEGHTGGVWALQYVGDTLVSGSIDRTVRIWNIKEARCTHIFTGHVSTVRSLSILTPVPMSHAMCATARTESTDPDEMYPSRPLIVTGSRDKTLRVWKLPLPGEPEWLDQSTQDPYFMKSLQGHSNSVRAVNGYGDTLVSGSYDTTVRVWSINTGKCKFVLSGHHKRVYAAVLDHQRNRCISGSLDWNVRVWCLESGSCLYTLEGHTSLVGLLDLNRSWLVSAAVDWTLRVWDPETGGNIHKLEGHAEAISCFQHDEYKVVSGSAKCLKLWDIRTGKLVKDLFTECESIWQVRFSGSKLVAAVQKDNEAYLRILDFDYEPGTKTEKTVYVGNEDDIKVEDELDTAAAPDVAQS